jgi:RND family efflux transporter MFP subunit
MIRQRILVPAALLALLAAGGLGACSCSRAEAEPSPAAAPAAPAAYPVQGAAVRRGAILTRIAAAGSLVPRRESRIGAEVTGRIERVFVSVGDRVDAGAPLFQIDTSSYDAALRQASAGLDLARAQRHQIEADLARTRQLFERELVSPQQLEKLETSLEVARAQENQAEQAVAIARQNLDKTLVRAPYAGSIAQRLADEGTMGLTAPQTIVVVLQETAELEARVAIPETQLGLVQVGDRATVAVEGLGDAIATEVFAVADTADPATRTYLVRLRVPNPERYLKAGVFARVEIEPRAKANVLLVPREALRSEAGAHSVLGVRDGVAVALPVEVGLVSEESAEVLAGVSEGDVVLVGDGARAVSPGLAVEVVPAEGAAT